MSNLFAQWFITQFVTQFFETIIFSINEKETKPYDIYVSVMHKR